MNLIAGISGAARNAAVAIGDRDGVLAVCEQERVTRTRRAGLRPGQLPLEALEAAISAAGRSLADVSIYAIAEEAIVLPPDLRSKHVDHHHAHAATAFLTSPFSDAVVLVCDRHGTPPLSIWHADTTGLVRQEFPWTGPGLAEVYSLAAEGLGFAADGDEHRLESLAHCAAPDAQAGLPFVTYRGDRLDVSADIRVSVADLVRSGDGPEALTVAAEVAARIQRHLGTLLLQLVTDVKRRFGGRHLCLGGGLFYNSFFNTLVAQSGLYERTFVPVNPGNAGTTVGAALVVDPAQRPRVCAPLSPFLGPAYGTNDVKSALDNCKLSYDYAGQGQAIDQTAAALSRGKLVGWFQGRMEWGPRALGNRSILASPVAPFVLENLNSFLKKRESHRSYSVSIPTEDAPRYFRGPSTSDFMEHEYAVLDSSLLRALLPLEATTLRVQTVPASAGLFHTLLKAFGAVTGIPMLVNTSFNGFNEPIVCAPRDAIRVFYGTGLDMAVIAGFVLQK